MPSPKRSFPFSLDDADTFSHISNHHLQHQQQPMQHEHEHEKNEEVDEELEEAEEQRDAEEEEEEKDDVNEEEEEDDDEDEEEDEEEDEDEEEAGEHQNNNNDEKPLDSDETPPSDSDDKSEFIYIELQDIRQDFQCPICLGIIKKTRTVMECLHRFCKECIDKSMRLGNNECPACRTHCASRRSLRDDVNYDALIASLYPDIEKYEEEELEFREDDKSRNKQIQESIAKVAQQQTEPAGKRRKDTPGALVTRSLCNQRNVHSRRQNGAINIQGLDTIEEEDDNNEKDTSSDDEHCIEARQRKRMKHTRVCPSQRSPLRENPDDGCIETDIGISRENGGISRHVTIPHKLTWGRGGSRSHTWYGTGGGSSSKSSRRGRLSKFVDHLRNMDENTDEFENHLMLVSLDKLSTPILQQPHLRCRPTLSVKHLCEYVACQTPLAVDEVEILAVKGCGSSACEKSADDTSALISDELAKLGIDPCNDELEILQEHEYLAGITSKCISRMKHSILAYRRKKAL